MDQPVSGNVLVNANLPAGTTAIVTGFSIAGSGQIITPGQGPVPVLDPATGVPIGTLVMQSNGAYTFDPVPGYVGPAPAVSLYLSRSDGQTAVSTLTIDVASRECRCQPATAALLLPPCCYCLTCRPAVLSTSSTRLHAQWAAGLYGYSGSHPHTHWGERG